MDLSVLIRAAWKYLNKYEFREIVDWKFRMLESTEQ
jgi:hypothetical protein